MSEFHDVFISYGRADSKAFARKLTDRLMDAGLDVWFDFDDIPLGVDYQNQIDDGIERSHNFLFLISPHSVNSAYCRLEIELALKCQKRIIPLMHVEEISRETWQQRNPSGTDAEWDTYTQAGRHSSYPNLHPALGKINWVFFREEIDDFEASLQGLHSIFERHQAYVTQHTYLLARSLHWQRNYRQTRELLSGSDRLRAEEWLRVRFHDEQPPCNPTDLHCEFITESTKNANNLMTQVFLAHADADTELSERLRRSLNRESFTVWTSDRDVRSGSDYAAANNQGIEEADNIVCLLSPELLHSPECQRQIRHAISLNKRLIPLMVRPVSAAEMPEDLRLIQTIDLIEPDNSTVYDNAIARLIKNLRNDEDYYSTHKMVLTRALKWQRQGYNSGVLLRGHNLKRVQGWIKIAQTRSLHGSLPIQAEFVQESLKLPSNETLEVFLSYSRTDGDLARSLNHALQACGKTTWFDQESIDPGEDFQQEVRRGIENSDNFLFIISPDSIASPHCDDEINVAQSLNKRIITVLARAVDAKQLHSALASLQWIDFSAGEPVFHSAFSELVRTLDTDRDHVHQHTKWSQRSREWQAKHRSPDLLLRGNEFSLAQTWLTEALDNNKHPDPTALQQEFIAASQAAIEAQIRKEKRQVTILRSLLASVSVVAVIAIGASAIAFQSRRQALRQELIALSKQTNALLASNQGVEALAEGVRGINRLRSSPWAQHDPEVSNYLSSSLLDSLYWAQEINQLEGHREGVRGVAYSPDGQHIVTTSVDGSVKFWQRNGNLLFTLTDHTDRVRDVAFSPDGSMFATASSDRTIRLWRRDGATLKVIRGHEDTVQAVSFSPDGDRLASGSSDGTAKLWDTSTPITSSRFGSLVETLSDHTDWVRDVVFSPDGRFLASAGDDQTIRLWPQTNSAAAPTVLDGHRGTVEGIDFSPDSRWLVSGGHDRTVRLWDMRAVGNNGADTNGVDTNDVDTNGDENNSNEANGNEANGNEANGNEANAAQSTAQPAVQILEGHSDRVEAVAFSPDGRTIASASDDRTVRLWNDQGQLLNVFRGHRNSVVGVDFSPDGTQLATASWDMTARLWQTQNPLISILRGHQTPVRTVAYSPTGDRLATGNSNGTVIVWNRDGEKLLQVSAHPSQVTQLSFSPDGKLMATSSLDGTVKLWDASGDLRQTLSAHQGAVHTVAFHPDGETLLTGGSDRVVRLWSLNGQQRQVFTGHTGEIERVAFSPDGDRWASVSEDKTIILWNEDGIIEHPLHGHTGAILALSFNPVYDQIATAGHDRNIRIWSRDGDLIRVLSGHQDHITDLEFSPDGELLVSNAADGSIRFWTRQGVEMINLKGRQEQASGLAFSPDGRHLASGSADDSILVWQLDLINNRQIEPLRATACQWIQDYLTTNDRVEFGDRPLCD